MEIILYSVTDDSNRINKTLSNGVSIELNLRRETDLINPSILLESIEGVNYSDYNYLFIVDMGRYYFIDGIDSINARLWRLTCTCDVLMTFKADILASNARIMRSIKNGDYGNFAIERKSVKSVSLIESNVSLEGTESTIILTAIGES